ncbi:MAG TPA: UDP-N-acetylmuramoyl-L-alanine--D-glutamate ligase [Thermoanaerobaculia bacterium]|nr:UDP-N-acetylmuramoyl-L-alanine--D-glutamate ligase [Thermoanaerobaculia bacterium]
MANQSPESVLVFGAGKSGVAAANFLVAQGTAVTITDSKNESELPLIGSLSPRVTRAFGSHPESLLDDARYIVLSPGIPMSIPILARAEARGIPILSEVELAFQNLQGTVIAVTGSNGKSTTTALIGEILRVAGLDPVVAGNIGVPLISVVEDGERCYVVELSSFQLETIDSFRANVALLLNVTPDHMDRYDSIDDYQRAKERIFRNQHDSDFAIVNAEDPRTVHPPTKAVVWRFSSLNLTTPGAFVDGDDLVLNTWKGEERIPRASLRISGTANVENALAAWLAAHAVGVGPASVKKAFESFAGLPHRMVLVRELEGVSYINDSKGTNVDATIKSLEGQQDGRVLLILGGKDKNGEFERLGDLVRKKTRAILTVGAAAPRIRQALSGTSEIIDAGTMDKALEWARSHSNPGDVVLLSPACASFDQYDNFEHRGHHFEELVRNLS